MTEPERIEFIIQVLESGNGAAFGKKIGMSPANVSKMRKGQIGFRLNKEGIHAIHKEEMVDRRGIRETTVTLRHTKQR